MASVGVRELKNQATEILRAVREEQAEYVITLRGKPIAVLLPLEKEWEKEAQKHATAAAVKASTDIWLELANLRKKIDQKWQSDQSAVEHISAQRR